MVGEKIRNVLLSFVVCCTTQLACTQQAHLPVAGNDIEVRVCLKEDASVKSKGRIRIDTSRWIGGRSATFVGPQVTFGQIVSLIDHSQQRHGYVVIVVAEGNDRNVYLNWDFWDLERPVRMLLETESGAEVLQMQQQGAKVVSLTTDAPKEAR